MRYLNLKIFSVAILALVSILTVYEFDYTAAFLDGVKTSDERSRQIQALQNELNELKSLSEKEKNEIQHLLGKLEDAKKQSETSANEKVSLLEEKLKNMRSQRNRLKKRLQEKDLPKHRADKIEEENKGCDTNSDESPKLFEKEEICSYFPTLPFTASEIWQRYIDRIFHASHNPDMPQEVSIYNNTQEASKMQRLLHHTLAPSRMRKGLLHMPTLDSSHKIVRNVVRILQNRIRDPANHPPLKIAVLGGSVTIGRLCYTKGMRHDACAWPRRFELLVNQFVGFEVIKVYNLGIGGTNTNTASRMVDYWMYPDELKKEGPDVIINSYSTNDSTPPWDMADDADSGSIVTQQIRDRVQSFIRIALSSRPCGIPPLVVNIDDYLGPLHNNILAELSYKTTVSQLAKWYDTVAISYAEVVRDIAYANTTDTTFINEEDVHFGYWAHQTIAWSLGFGSLDLLSHYCDDEYRLRSMVDDEKLGDDDSDSDSLNIDHQPLQVFLPPPLTKELMLDNATAEFQAAKESIADLKCDAAPSDIDGEGSDERSSSTYDKNPCAIAWISSPGMFDGGKVQSFMKKYEVSNKEWEVETNLQNGGWTNKVGWIATSPNATFTLAFKDMDKDVNAVTIFYLKSYGEKWADSKARFTFSVEADSTEGEVDTSSILLETDIWGVHNVSASLTVSEKFMLSESLPKGRPMTMKVDMLSGSTFKIMGMMFCRH